MNFYRPIHRAALAVLVGTVAACSDVTGPAQGPTLTRLPRELTAGERQVLRAGNDFSLALFRQLAKAQPGKNVFVSPLSASMALGMTMNGARGTTLDAMRATLGMGTADLQQINAGYKGLIDLLRGLDPSTTFHLANSIWYRNGFPVQQTFLDAVKAAFSAEVRGLNFNDPSSVSVINAWVNANTQGKIPTILGEISPDDQMYLINAIYFKASWRTRFDSAPVPILGVELITRVHLLRQAKSLRRRQRIGNGGRGCRQRRPGRVDTAVARRRSPVHLRDSRASLGHYPVHRQDEQHPTVVVCAICIG